MAYMDFKRKKKAVETLKIIHECADGAGIRHALFVNFGLLLGIIRHGSFIPWDTDIDMCVKRDQITPEQEVKYFNLIKESGLFKARKKWSTVKDKNGYEESAVVKGGSSEKVRLTWFSLRKEEGYPKFCHWLMFPWNNMYWHTKAGKWVTPSKFDPVVFNYNQGFEAIMKGVPEKYLTELMTIKFYGIDVQIPTKYGSCLDFLYPGWMIPQHRGSSAKKIVCVAQKFDDIRTWKTLIL